MQKNIVQDLSMSFEFVYKLCDLFPTKYCSKFKHMQQSIVYLQAYYINCEQILNISLT